MIIYYLSINSCHSKCFAFRIIKSVHGFYIHDHIETKCYDQGKNEGTEKTHPDANGEESCAIPSNWEGSIFWINCLQL